jgi:hypothetical protein
MMATGSQHSSLEDDATMANRAAEPMEARLSTLETTVDGISNAVSFAESCGRFALMWLTCVKAWEKSAPSCRLSPTLSTVWKTGLMQPRAPERLESRRTRVR